eukprot:TRINITY_DN106_c0_g4_i1.p1 TRINITY_DN106_c0_g4~~TRINITY_DN106_c0_g4_i1.p1  ORF type:complete len:366 (+),score=86.06 TRINITY_DN106_c0_g4_i1:43-1140(+)
MDSKLPVTSNEVIECSFDHWYKNFESVTIKSKYFPLSSQFVEYLKADGIILPKLVVDNPKDPRTYETEKQEWERDQDLEEIECDEQVGPEFPRLEEQIDEFIIECGGSVFPKLNWSAPKDCVYTCGTLESTSAGDVYMLLKSSEILTYDLLHAYDECVDEDVSLVKKPSLILVLKKWFTFFPEREFRCYVKNGELIAIEQRTDDSAGTLKEDMYNELREVILTFFKEEIMEKFPLESYVFDVYVNKKNRCYLVDFSPFGGATDTSIFSWNEIQNLSTECKDSLPPIRHFDDKAAIHFKPEQLCNVPQEFLDVAMAKLGLESNLDREAVLHESVLDTLIAECQRQDLFQNPDDDDDDDDDDSSDEE